MYIRKLMIVMTRLKDILTCIPMIELMRDNLKKCTIINWRFMDENNIKYKTDYFKEYESDSESESE